MHGERINSQEKSGTHTLCGALFFLWVFSIQLAFGQDNWKGGAGNWNNGADWSAGVPSSTSNVFIDNGNGAHSPVTVSDGEQCADMTIDSDDSVTLVNGAIFNVYGPTISNAGGFSLSATGGGGTNFDINGNVTLTGAGGLTMSNNANNVIFGYGQVNGHTLTNQSTIQGSGTIQPGCNNTVNNQGTINANQSTPLYISICTGPMPNTGTLEATNGGTLILEGNAGGAGTFDNTGGGVIRAGAGSTVVLYDSAIVKNGTLSSTSTGVIQGNGNNGAPTLDGVTITGTHQEIAGVEYLANTITNNGSFQVGTNTTNANLDISGSVTLQGTGTLTMTNLAGNTMFGYGQANGATLTNKSTIQGSGTIQPGCNNTLTNQGTINANQSTPLYISICTGPLANTGTLEATNGGTLVLEGDASGHGTFDNTGGGIITAGAGSNVTLYDSAILKNGTLSSTSTGVTQANGNNGAPQLDGVTISGSHQLIAGVEYLNNTITNNGTFTLGSTTTNVNLDINGSVILKGSGKLIMANNPNNVIFGYGQNSGATLTNQSTIGGAGTINIPGSGGSFTNQHIVEAIYSNPLIINTGGGPFSNSSTGSVTVSKGDTLYIEGGDFTNFAGSTLTGGKYNVTGTFKFDSANIVTNAAGITLTGSTAQIVNQSNVNALAPLATNMSTGSFTASGGQLYTTTLSGAFSNAGKVTVGKNSSFTVACTSGFQCPYTQSAGTTTVDGTLSDSLYGVKINGGSVFGTGTITGQVTSSGAVTAGDSLTKAGVFSPGAYVQNSTGKLNVQIGGTTVGTQYSQLAVANGASLHGTLNIKLINGFIPANGEVFTILKASAVTGTFSTVNGLSYTGGRFTIAYNANSVTLTAGP